MVSLCPKKEVCGSCSWSHIPYEKQLEQKISDINGSFKLKGLSLLCKDILPSPKLEHYRNRMDFVIDFEGRVGMRQKDKWWKVIDDHTCFLADSRIDVLFQIIRTWVHKSGLSYYDRKTHQGVLRYAVIRATSIGQTMLVIVTSEPKDDVERSSVLSNLSNLSNFVNSSSIIWSINKTDSDVSFGTELCTISGNGWIEESIDNITYCISPNAFFQTNSSTSPLLLEIVKKFCGDLTNKTVLDLYCGTGFFSIAMASNAKKMIGIELNSDAIHDAKINAEQNGIKPEFIVATTESFDWSIYNPDIIILDPPRSGMHDQALRDLLVYQPKEIIYVSCNYKNLAREMVQLQSVYDVAEMIAIDQFPHTPHVELITKLVHKTL